MIHILVFSLISRNGIAKHATDNNEPACACSMICSIYKIHLLLASSWWLNIQPIAARLTKDLIGRVACFEVTTASGMAQARPS